MLLSNQYCKTVAFWTILVSLTNISNIVQAFSGLSTKAFTQPKHLPISHTNNKHPIYLSESTSSSETNAPTVPAPTFDGKLVFPMRAFTIGLKGHTVAAVYAIMNQNHKRSSPNDSWSHTEMVGMTLNLDKTLEEFSEQYDKESMAHVRAVSFAYPQKVAMEEISKKWFTMAEEAGGNAKEVLRIGAEDMVDESVDKKEESVSSLSEVATNDGNIGLETEEEKEQLRRALEASKYIFDEDDDDDYFDDDDDEDFMLETLKTIHDESPTSDENPESVISPFDETESKSAATTAAAETTNTDGTLAFNRENVDKVLDEVRPYLISDGGNVSVHSIDEKTKNVYLVLEGACGSCPSSTVTMQMGIERVLKENFMDLGSVEQITPEESEDAPTELTLEAVQREVNRLSPALIAMGGVVRIVSVDPIGVVKIEFRGSNKIRNGLELALLDVPYCKHVEFVN